MDLHEDTAEPRALLTPWTPLSCRSFSVCMRRASAVASGGAATTAPTRTLSSATLCPSFATSTASSTRPPTSSRQPQHPPSRCARARPRHSPPRAQESLTTSCAPISPTTSRAARRALRGQPPRPRTLPRRRPPLEPPAHAHIPLAVPLFLFRKEVSPASFQRNKNIESSKKFRRIGGRQG